MEQLRIRCSESERMFWEEKCQHTQTKLSFEIAERERDASIRELESTIVLLTQQTVDLKDRLDKANLLLEQEQQNLRINARQLELTQRKFMTYTALRVEGSFACLVDKLEEILCDPISLELIEDPVILPSGNTIGRPELVKMETHGYVLDPMTREPHKSIYDNILASQLLDAFGDFKRTGAIVRFVGRLDDLLVDSESFRLIEAPVVLPSGNTVSTYQIERMQKKGILFDHRTRCLLPHDTPLYKNLLVAQVLDAFKEFLGSSA